VSFGVRIEIFFEAPKFAALSSNGLLPRLSITALAKSFVPRRFFEILSEYISPV